LAQILSQTRGADAAPLAAEALHDSELPAAARIRSLYILAADHYRNQRPVQAIELLQELIRLRRCSADWALLGFCELARADSRAAVSAFETAVALNPRLLPVHRELVRLYEAAGDFGSANLQRSIGRRLQAIADGSAPSHRPTNARR